MSTQAAALPNAETLPDDLSICHRMILELLELLRTTRHEADSLRHRLDELLRRLYGKRSEKLDPAQLLLFPELLEAVAAAAADDLAAAEPATTDTEADSKK